MSCFSIMSVEKQIMTSNLIYARNKYILLHDWEGNTGEYSVRGWQYCPSLRSGQYCHPRTEYSPVLSDPKGMHLLYDSNLVGKNGKRKKKKRGEREKKKVRAGVAGEARTRSPSLVKTVL